MIRKEDQIQEVLYQYKSCIKEDWVLYNQWKIQNLGLVIIIRKTVQNKKVWKVENI